SPHLASPRSLLLPAPEYENIPPPADQNCQAHRKPGLVPQPWGQQPSCPVSRLPQSENESSLHGYNPHRHKSGLPPEKAQAPEPAVSPGGSSFQSVRPCVLFFSQISAF